MAETVAYTTAKCSVCGERTKLVLDKLSFDTWIKGTYIQDAFPYKNADERELIKTGTHSECWDAMMGSDDEDEDDAGNDGFDYYGDPEARHGF